MRDESGGVTPSGAPGEVTRVVFAGGTSAHEWEAGALGAALADPENGAHQPAVEYIRGSDWGGGIGGILYTLRGGQPGYSHYNSRGDVVAKTDAAGSLTYRASYEAFGTRTQEQGAAEDRQRANTKDEDPTGLLNEGFRYRDLVAGVWLTRDPAGFVDGPNLYAYVRQNPWTKFDPHGLNAQKGNRVRKALIAAREAFEQTGKINGRRPKNCRWAGNTKPWNKMGKKGADLQNEFGHIAEGVPFRKDGTADFSAFAKDLPGGRKNLKFGLGELKSNKGDFNKQAFDKLGISKENYKELVDGYVWEHASVTTLELVPRKLHEAVGHTGGSALIESAKGIAMQTGAAVVAGGAALFPSRSEGF